MKNELIIKSNINTEKEEEKEEGIVLLVVNDEGEESDLLTKMTKSEFMDIERKLSDDNVGFINAKVDGDLHIYNKSEIKKITFSPNFIIYQDELYKKSDFD